MYSLLSIFFFVVACVAAYQTYLTFRPSSRPLNASAPNNDANIISTRLGGSLWGAIAVGSALAAFYFDWLD
jgi:hypothetical protein